MLQVRLELTTSALLRRLLSISTARWPIAPLEPCTPAAITLTKIQSSIFETSYWVLSSWFIFCSVHPALPKYPWSLQSGAGPVCGSPDLWATWWWMLQGNPHSRPPQSKLLLPNHVALPCHIMPCLHTASSQGIIQSILRVNNAQGVGPSISSGLRVV